MEYLKELVVGIYFYYRLWNLLLTHDKKKLTYTNNYLPHDVFFFLPHPPPKKKKKKKKMLSFQFYVS